MDPEILKQLMAMLGKGAPADASGAQALGLPQAPTPELSGGSVGPPLAGSDFVEEQTVELGVPGFLGGPGKGAIKGIDDLMKALGKTKTRLDMGRNRGARMTGELRRDVQASKVAGDVEPNIDKMLKLIDDLPEGPKRTKAIKIFDDFMDLQENMARGGGKSFGVKKMVPELDMETIARLMEDILVGGRPN